MTPCLPLLRRLSLWLLLAGAGAAPGLAVAPTPTVIVGDTMQSQSTATQTISVFDGHVHVDGTDLTLDCDHLKIISNRVGEANAAIGHPTGLRYLLATGHVRLRQVGGAREATCGRAELLPDKDEIVLRDHPVVIDHAAGVTESGEWMELFRGQERVIVHSPRVVGPPMKDMGFEKKAPAPTRVPAAGNAPPTVAVPSSPPSR